MGTTKVQTNKTAATVWEYLEAYKDDIAKAVPSHISFEKLMRVAYNSIVDSPDLQACTAMSLQQAIVQCSILGLEPGALKGLAYLVPFHDRKAGVRKAQLIVSYKGMIALAERAENMQVWAREVREKDVFEVQEGTHRRIHHAPDYRLKQEERGKVYCYYAVYEKPDGRTDFEIMQLEEIEKVRDSSKAAQSGPWVDWFDEMAKKTVIKRLLKRKANSTELAKAIELDHAAASGQAQTFDHIDVRAKVAGDAPKTKKEGANDEPDNDNDRADGRGAASSVQPEPVAADTALPGIGVDQPEPPEWPRE